MFFGKDTGYEKFSFSFFLFIVCLFEVHVFFVVDLKKVVIFLNFNM